MKRLFLFASALAIVSCNQTSEAPDENTLLGDTTGSGAFKSIWTLGACDGLDGNVVGTINIDIPPTLNGSGVLRGNGVTYGSTVLTPGSDNSGRPAQGWTANLPGDGPPPFDVFMAATDGIFGNTGFALVRITILGGGNNGWNFLAEQGFYGVGAYSDNGGVFCGANPLGGDPNANGSHARSVASFYVDLEKLENSGDGKRFVIGLKADSTDGTPIFIDPKIWNGGGGGVVVDGAPPPGPNTNPPPPPGPVPLPNN